jgi:hypothetical protein
LTVSTANQLILHSAEVVHFHHKQLLTPKIGTRKELTCGPNFVTKCHSAGKISLEDSVKMLAVGNTLSFGRRTVCAFKRKFSGMRDDVARI